MTRGLPTRRIVAALGVPLLAWLGAVAYARAIVPAARAVDAAKTVELSRREVRRLSELHGTNVIRVERGTVSILRDGRWIPVSRGERG